MGSTGLYKKSDTVILGSVGIVGVILLWQIAASLHWMNPVLISSPSRVALALYHWAATGLLWRDLGTSVLELVIGFAAAAVVGVFLGTVMGWKSIAEYALDPFVWILYATPLVSLWPLFIIWLGIGLEPIIALAFLFSVVPIIINTFTAIKGVDPVLIRCARSFNARPVDLFFRFTLPGALPMILAGLRLGIGRSLIGVVIGELFTSNAGLGFHISFYGTRLQFADVFAGLFVVVVLGLASTQVIRVIEARFERWKT